MNAEELLAAINPAEDPKLFDATYAIAALRAYRVEKRMRAAADKKPETLEAPKERKKSEDAAALQ